MFAGGKAKLKNIVFFDFGLYVYDKHVCYSREPYWGQAQWGQP
jgi:hypothetical protein